MVTEFGKTLRIIRINTGDSAKVMAEKLGMSPAYLSAIETGKRNIPPGMEDLVLQNYRLSDFDKNKLHQSIIETTSVLKVDLTDMEEKKKKVIYSITEGNLDEETLDLLDEIIKKRNNKENDL